MNIFTFQPQNAVYEIGDFIEFKSFTSIDAFEYILCKGEITDNTNLDILEIKIYDSNTKNFTKEVCWINSALVIRYYPKYKIPTLSTRLIIKDIWKDLIFREVKTVKNKDESMVTYDYINDSGFVRTKTFDTIDEAFKKVPVDKHCNIHIHYRDYFGFTTHRAIRNNDIYCNQEIFFSRKCYGELNLNNKTITGNFSLRRGYKSVPPQKKQYVCGLVETGEKGLFYRKWFICSEEFLKLWTMICEPEHYSLKNKTIDGNYITKSFEEITKDLDTSKYDISSVDIPTKLKKEKYKSYNVETQVLYIPRLYQKIIQSIFKPVKRDNFSLYPTYEERFRSDIAWMKNIKI